MTAYDFKRLWNSKQIHLRRSDKYKKNKIKSAVGGMFQKCLFPFDGTTSTFSFFYIVWIYINTYCCSTCYALISVGSLHDDFDPTSSIYSIRLWIASNLFISKDEARCASKLFNRKIYIYIVQLLSSVVLFSFVNLSEKKQQL